MMHLLRSVYRFISPRFQTAHLDYKVHLRPRHGHGRPAHPQLLAIVEQNRANYAALITDFLAHTNRLGQIRSAKIETNPDLPAWNNGFLPGLDMVALYGMMAKFKPKRYFEVGSGNSTKVARLAVNDLGLETRITSIDPYPRANIDHLAHVVIRKPFENVTDLAFITQNLDEGDFLFIDNSHRSFANSDVTVFFLEVLPLLKKGVVVHVHDIYIPFDYPQFMADRYYNEQYLLAAFVLANPEKYNTLFPAYFVSEDAQLSKALAPVWQQPNLAGVERHGGSYWLQIA